eukprot:2434378-Amphidinium_carterae.1
MAKRGLAAGWVAMVCLLLRSLDPPAASGCRKSCNIMRPEIQRCFVMLQDTDVYVSSITELQA